MLSCDVISDLMVVYASGEASPETKRLVEEHLARCPACREAFGKEQAVEEALAALEPVEEPSNGRRFIARTRRLLFSISAGALALFACVLAGFERVVMGEFADIPLPHLPGPSLLWLAVAAVMLALYVVLLIWRRGWESDTGMGNLLLSMLTAAPLLVLVLAVYDLVGTGGALSVAAAGLFLLIALGVTFSLLPRLPYATLATVLVLLLVNGVLVGKALAGVVALGDYGLETPAELGHPPDELAVEEAVPVDLTSVGLEWVDSTERTWVNNVWIGPQADAVRAAYSGDGSQGFVTIIRFENQQRADEFFTSWKQSISSAARVAHFEINLSGLADQGRLTRFYDAVAGRAFSAWQNENWVTIVEVPGSLSQAMPLAREIKETVANSYRR